MELEIDLLRCFAAVAEEGGFTAAGSRIGLTQSAVSQRIRRLEDRLGRRLLVRTTRTLSLSTEGEMLLHYAQRMLALHDEALARLSASSIKGALRIGFVDYFGPDAMPETVRQFIRSFPDIHLELHAGLGMELRQLFDHGKLDVLVAGDDGQHTGTCIARDTLVWACHTAYNCAAARPAFMLDHLAAEPAATGAPVPLVALPLPCVFRSAAIAALESLQRPWEVVFTATGMASVLAAVRAGLGITVLPRSALTPDLKIPAPEEGFPPLPAFSTCIYANDNVNLQALEALTRHLRQQLGTQRA
ncbi:LysR family transcriptional regulator [Oleidesulfovibrio alaskensis]|jgi:DNA-binding transcriptional LysR family regulator